MTNDLKKIAGLGAIVLALTAAPAIAQEALTDWDSSGDGVIDQNEFNEGWNGLWQDETAFESWDEDGDGMLTEEEYNAGVYSSYDADGSGVIEEPEFGDIGDDIGDGGFWDI